MIQMLADAYAFAAHAHAAQRMKGDREDPFIEHPCRVAALVAETTPDSPEAVIAAVLHDVVEDTEASAAEVAERFGPAVAELVGWVTDDPEIEDLPLDERKARQAAKISEAPDLAKIVKIADQLDNMVGRLHAFAHWRLERHRGYLAGARLVVEACRRASPELAARFDAKADELAARIAAAEGSAP